MAAEENPLLKKVREAMERRVPSDRPELPEVREIVKRGNHGGTLLSDVLADATKALGDTRHLLEDDVSFKEPKAG